MIEQADTGAPHTKKAGIRYTHTGTRTTFSDGTRDYSWKCILKVNQTFRALSQKPHSDAPIGSGKNQLKGVSALDIYIILLNFLNQFDFRAMNAVDGLLTLARCREWSTSVKRKKLLDKILSCHERSTHDFNCPVSNQAHGTLPTYLIEYKE